jgi:autophagy-related protein 101
LTLPFVDDDELDTLIDQRTATLVRQLDTSSDMGARNQGVRGLMAVQFFEKKRRKAWFTKGEEEVCWEQWTLDVTLATPRTESGMFSFESFGRDTDVMWGTERAKVRKAMEAMLLKAAMKIVTTVNREKDHIPPITTSEANPFPYQIVVNPKDNGWGARMGIF